MSGKHYLLGPSSMNRIIHCPGSLYGPPVYEPASDAAEEGTTCHALLEFCLSFGDNPRNHLGSKDFNEKFPITIEMVEAVELFNETVDGLLAEFSIDRSRVVSEQRLVHPDIPDEMFGGTSDCVIVGDDTLIILDLKFGRRPVFADSPQLTAYSLLVLGNMRDRQFSRVVQVIVQPRCNPSVSRYEPGSQELTDLWGNVCNVAAFVQANPDLLVPKPEALAAGDWCKYCKRREGCPAKMALVDGFVEVSTMTVPGDEGLKVIAGGTAQVPTEQLLQYKKLFDVISEFMKDVDRTLVERAAIGAEIPGHKLVLKWGNRQWVDEDETMRKKIPRVLKGVAAKDITEQGCMSPAKVEKVLKEKGLWKDLKDKFEKLCTSTQTGVKLVDARAKGEAIRPETAQEFLETLKKDQDVDA
jgi:hypothetical protein